MWYNAPINVEIIKFIQSFSTPFLDNVFQYITMFGEETFFMVIIPIVYWCINKEFGFRLGFTYLSSAVVNYGLKEYLMVPRPIGEPGIRSLRLETATGYSFPSGHTQGSASFWMVFMLHYKKKWIDLMGIIIILLVGLSRLYLGVHRPVDVMGGIIIGFVWVIVSNYLFYAAEKIGNKGILLAAIVPMLIFLFIFPNADYSKALATVIAFYAGYIIEPKYIRFDVGGGIQKQILKLVIGLGVMFAIRLFLKQLLPENIASEFVRYFLIGAWGVIGAPYMFKKFLTPPQNTEMKVFIQK